MHINKDKSQVKKENLIRERLIAVQHLICNFICDKVAVQIVLLLKYLSTCAKSSMQVTMKSSLIVMAGYAIVCNHLFGLRSV